jgi:large subunit ribosomal protein L40e
MAGSSRLRFNQYMRIKCNAYTKKYIPNPKELAKIQSKFNILHNIILIDSNYLHFLPNIADIQKELDFFEYVSKIDQLEKLMHAYTAANIDFSTPSGDQSDTQSDPSYSTSSPSTDLINLYKYYMSFSGLKNMNVNSIQKSEIYSFLKKFMPNSINILVKTLTGKHIKVCVNPYEQIEDLTLKIQKQEGIPISQQQIIFAGKQLNITNLIMSYRILNDNILHLVLSLRGGMHHESSTGKNYFHIRSQDIKQYDEKPSGPSGPTIFDEYLSLHSINNFELILPPNDFPCFPIFITYQKKTIEFHNITTYTQLHELIQSAFEYKIPRRYVIYCSIKCDTNDTFTIIGTMSKQ